MNYKTVLGYITAFGVLGFASYAIYKYIKNKDGETMVISAEEARSEIEQYRNAKMDEYSEEFEAMRDGIIDQANLDRSFMGHPPTYHEDDEEIDEEETLEEEDDEVIEEEEVVERKDREELKHNPNSKEALDQFIHMELADFHPQHESYHKLLRLFDFPFSPVNDGDKDLKSRLIDYRIQFFGLGSKWIHDVSFADLMLYYARSASYNCNETVPYWVDYFFQFNGLSNMISSYEIDAVIDSLNNHIYYNDFNDTHGMFGLTNDAINNATNIAMRNIDNSLTYDIEFNEFLKMCN